MNKLSENDIEMFALKNNIFLNKTETKILYQIIKEKYDILLYGNSEEIFKSNKKNFSLENYEKIKTLYEEYKQKYSAYL